jgi:Uma2 family endonuclease
MRTDIKYTYKEYRSLPETGPRYELMEGELLLSPSPSYFHQILAANLFRALDAVVRKKRLGVVLFSPLDVILSEEDVLQPDIVYVSNARRGIIAPEGLRGAPDLCVEVLSPSTRELDREAKRVLYARHGVVELWLVDPDARTVELFRLQEEPHKPTGIYGEGQTLISGLFPELTISVNEVFAQG